MWFWADLQKEFGSIYNKLSVTLVVVLNRCVKDFWSLNLADVTITELLENI